MSQSPKLPERSGGLDSVWREILDEMGLRDALLLSASKIDRGRRTYLLDGRVYKVLSRQLDETGQRRTCSLEEECRVLQRLEGVRGIPQRPAYSSTTTAECIGYDYIEGRPLEELTASTGEKLHILCKIAVILTRVSCYGIVHNDVLGTNLIVGPDGGVTLIDFDQSTETTVAKAALANFTGGTFGMRQFYGTYLSVCRKLFRDKLPTPVFHALRRTRKLFRDASPRTRPPRISHDADPKLHKLRKAWLAARRSQANAPGTPICYYELCENGYRFPGERPWQDRWATLRSATVFKGRRVLELGCNLSLLSCFLLKDEGIGEAMCIDADSSILAAAQLVADAYGVSPFYRRVNFDGPDDWESGLLHFKPDVVFALSVLNWVEDKQRLLKFLSNFNEVIFEGHDSLAIERERFSNLGFKEIELIAESERNRAVLHCRK